MRKVTKILLKLLSTIVLLLIILPLTISLALSFGGVQNYVVHRAASIASRELGTRVSVGSVHFSMLTDVIMHDVLVEDFGGDTLLFASSASARISAFSLLGKELSISNVQVKQGELQLREVEPGLINIKQVVDKLLNEERQGEFLTQIDRIGLEQVNFSLKRMAQSREEYGVDLTDIRVDNMTAQLTDFVSHDRITQLTIRSCSGVERSGLPIRSLSGNLVTYEGVVDLFDMFIKTDSSTLNIPKLRLESDLWEDYRDFNSQVSIELSSQGSRLAVSDVAYFAPALEGCSFVANSLTMMLNGTVDNLEVQIPDMQFGEQSAVAAELAIIGADTLSTASFNANITRSRSTLPDINYIMTSFEQTPLSGSLAEVVGRMGQLELEATAEGDLQNIILETALTSRLGSIAFEGSVSDLAAGIKCDGDITVAGVEAGCMIDNGLLGAVNCDVSVHYHQSRSGVDAFVRGRVGSVAYNSCLYSDIDIEATYKDDSLELLADSHDPKLDVDIAALLLLGERQHYDVTMRVNDADLVALALNKRDTVSRISGSLRVNMGFSSLEDLSGVVTLRNLNYLYDDKSIYAPMVAVDARNSSENKYISLESDYIDMTFTSKSSFEGLYSYIGESLRQYIPMLYNEHKERAEGERKVTLADNYSTLMVDFKNVAPLSDALSRGFRIADNSTFSVMVNPFSERFLMRFESEYVEHGNVAATGISINASNDKDSLSLYAAAADLFVERASFASCNLIAGARNNVVELSAGFRDTMAMRSATLGMRADFKGADSVAISLLPSQLSLGKDMWMISAGEILGQRRRLIVDDFAMVNGSQRLSLNGAISTDQADSLTLKLQNYDIGVITSVVSSLGYNVEGASNGYLHISQLFSNPRVVADIDLDSVTLNKIASPPLKLQADWNTEEDAAQLFVTDRMSRDTVMTGHYSPTDGRYDALLRVDSVSMSLIDPLLATTIADTKGYANIDVALSGQQRKASLHGAIDVYDLSTKILFTQVEYNVPSARIEIDDNILWSRSQKMYDSHGNSGLLTLNLSLDHLSNVSYMLRIVPENMLVLNTTIEDNELFYGTLFASGVATISGDKMGVNMDITATSQPNSSFFMPLSTSSAVAKTDFITFVERVVEAPTQDGAAVNYRRRFVEEREQRLNTRLSPRVNVNMALHATPDLDFQLVIDPTLGDAIRAKGEGRINLNIAPEENIFEMYGDYDITEGNYLFTLLNPISKRFTINSGSSIQWTGDPLDPQLNIDAVYMVKTSLDPLINSTSDYSSESSSRALPVDCIIHLGDRLSQPSVDFSIEVPTADTEQQAVISNTLIDQETISQQFFYLLLANSFVPVASTSTNVLTTSTTASTGFELLTNQLSNWLSSSNLDVVIRYRLGSDVDLTSDEVDLGFSRGFIDNRLLIELEGNYQADNKAAIDDSDLSNFMGEAYITWLIDKAGSLRLKGFTQTIDRYDENQGLQETGVGIYFSESFDNFRDLKRKIADRFRRKNKKEKI